MNTPHLERLRTVDAGAEVDDPAELVELVKLRYHAATEAIRTAPSPGAPRVDVPPAAPNRLPVSVDDLRIDMDAAGLRTALATYGCALVRGAVDGATIDALRDGIDRSLDAFDHVRERRDRAWFNRFNADPGFKGGVDRSFNRDVGSMFTADSPTMLARVVRLFERIGLTAVLTDFFGERPLISVNKCTLRRIEADVPNGGWHQDGAFMGGASIRSVNVWMPLTACGVDAPGLDIVPSRIDLAPAGTEGAAFDWSVSPVEVDRARGEVPVVRLPFEAGDLLLFDHRFLHRTAGDDPAMVNRRYAIETWCFPVGDYPSTQVPIAL